MYVCVRMLDLLELKLQTVVSYHVSAGLEPRASGRTAVLLAAEPSFCWVAEDGLELLCWNDRCSQPYHS